MLLAVGHNNADELFEQTAERKHKRGAENIEDRMNDRNSKQRCGFTQDQRREQRANDAVDR